MVQSINATTPLEDARAALASAYDLSFTKAVAKVTQYVYGRVRHRIAEADWSRLAPLIVQINRLKREKRATVFAHIRQPSEIYFGVADRVGDNLSLIRQATLVRQPNVVVAGVISLAETLKLFLPRRRILTPDSRQRSSLATSITPEDVMAIRAQYPGVPVIVHVDTSMPVKALADATFTSANALDVVEAMPSDRIVMLPDQFVAQNTARMTSKKIVTWAAGCTVHGSFDNETVEGLRRDFPDVKILAHPQTRPAVAAAADFIGSSAAMRRWLETERPARAAILSESAVADNLAVDLPGTEFVMNGKSLPDRCLTLEAILWSLHTMAEEVVVPADLIPTARAAVERMLDISRKKST